MAERLGVDRLEIANVQYYGWAIENREKLMPTRAATGRLRGHRAVRTSERLKGRMRIDFVPPDYYARYPKACMGGWGRSLMVIDPAGFVLPCHAAGVIPELTFDNVQARPLRWIWEESAAFQRFRGEDWMPEPCRSCDRRARGFRRLPLPGSAADRRRQRHRSGLLASPRSQAGGCGDRARQRVGWQRARMGLPHRPGVAVPNPLAIFVGRPQVGSPLNYKPRNSSSTVIENPGIKSVVTASAPRRVKLRCTP